MNILITGAKGFIGKNLISTLENIRDRKDRTFGFQAAEAESINIMPYDIDTDPALLDDYCRDADFVFHLAGVNRPEDPADFMKGNFGFTSVLLDTLKKHGNTCPVMISSSTQAVLDNLYGESKKAGEELLFAYGQETGADVLVYRFPNVFGKWCKPNYNSAVATFCNNIANGLPITVNDRSHMMTLVYIDDVVAELIAALKGKANKKDDGFCHVDIEHKITLGEIVDMLYGFRDNRDTGYLGIEVSIGNKEIPDVPAGSFSKKLYSTYLSYLPNEGFAYPLKKNDDYRGSFIEIFRTADKGQVSVNINKPGMTKGNHWHHTKNEKFVVVSGRGLIQLRKVGLDENGEPYPVIEYYVSGEEIIMVDMIPGYTHNLINLSDTEDLVTVIWANEPFDPEKPDTYTDPVE